MSETGPAFEGWAIVELLGHKKLAGQVREQTVAGGALLRVDVPATEPLGRVGRYDVDEQPATAPYTKLVGVGSIYAITPCSEEVARRAARVIERHNDPIPVTLPTPLPALPAGAESALPSEDADLVSIGAEDDDDDLERGLYYDGEG